MDTVNAIRLELVKLEELYLSRDRVDLAFVTRVCQQIIDNKEDNTLSRSTQV